MASPELDTVLRMIRAWTKDFGTTVEDNRLSYEKVFASLPLDEDITTERVGAGNAPAEWIVAPDAQDGRVLLYLHGGHHRSLLCMVFLYLLLLYYLYVL